MIWILGLWFWLQPVQVTKCDADTGRCVTYYENCYVISKGRVR